MPRDGQAGHEGRELLPQVPGGPTPEVFLPLPRPQGAQAPLVPPSARIFAPVPVYLPQCPVK